MESQFDDVWHTGQHLAPNQQIAVPLPQIVLRFAIRRGGVFGGIAGLLGAQLDPRPENLD